MIAVLKESELREPVGGPEVMREQLDHLLRLAREPNIAIQIVPPGAPVYTAGNITLLSFEEAGDLAYVESASTIDRVVTVAEVRRLGVRFDLLRSLALDISASEKLIRELMETL